MSELRTALADEECPVDDQMLGQIYRASREGLSELIATVPPDVRALLALYCFRRAHLASIGLVIAATCEKDQLTSVAGNAGGMLFARSREHLPAPSLVEVTANVKRRITLATFPLRDLSTVVEADQNKF